MELKKIFMNIVKWLFKKLIVLYYKLDTTWLASSFKIDDQTDINILVSRYYDDHYTVGTTTYKYPSYMGIPQCLIGEE